MIETWLLTGDKHGDFSIMFNALKNKYLVETTAIIILGDAGINFRLNKQDKNLKKDIENKKFYLYLIKGNHEMRCQHLENIKIMYDENVKGPVMYESEYPHIRYFMDYGIYEINGYRCLVVGGAYSVDKWYRLTRAGIDNPEMNNPKKTGWFSDECLTETEMIDCEDMIDSSGNNVFDFVFSHTCPKKYQPTDLFLGFIDQSTVDEGMEVWMDKLSEKIVVNIAWIYGHYHADRIERPHVEQYYHDIESLGTIAERWKRYDETGELDWWLVKGGLFDAS